MGGFCLLVELYREGSAPGACAAGLFISKWPKAMRNVPGQLCPVCQSFLPGSADWLIDPSVLTAGRQEEGWTQIHNRAERSHREK